MVFFRRRVLMAVLRQLNLIDSYIVPMLLRGNAYRMSRYWVPKQ